MWLTARGLDPAAIGFVLAAMQAVRVIATPAGTRIADRYGSLHRAIVITAVATAAAIVLLASATGFTFILVAAVTVAFVSAPVLPLTDAYGLKGLAQRGKSYGPVRLWGSVAFIAANLTGGVLLDMLAPGNLIWVICAGNCALAVAALLLPPMPRDTRAADRRLDTATCASRRFSPSRPPASLIQASHAVYYAFSTLDWTAKGFDGVTIGVLWALGVVAEIVLFAFAGAAAAQHRAGDADRDRRGRRDRALERDDVRSAGRPAVSAAAAARAVVRRDASRHDDVSVARTRRREIAPPRKATSRPRAASRWRQPRRSPACSMARAALPRMWRWRRLPQWAEDVCFSRPASCGALPPQG